MIFNLNDLFSVADIELTRHSSLRYNILLWSTLLQSNNSMKTITTQTHSYDKWLQELWTAGALAFKHFVHLRIVTTWPRLMKSEENIWRYLKELSIKVMWRRRIHGQGWFLHWFDDIHFSCVTQEITKQRLLSTETERQVYNLVGL